MTSSCEAVGSNLDRNGNQITLAETYDGAKWTSQPTPNPGGESFRELTAVSCSAANACSALVIDHVSYLFGSATLTVDRWNGSTWSSQRITLPSGEYGLLNGISCASATACMAVGSYGSQGSDRQHPLVEFWNGTTWTQQTVPVPAGETTAFLNGVSCKLPTVCVAVGGVADAQNTGSALAEAWNGTAWTAKLPAGAPAGFKSISCSVPGTCTAVGGGVGAQLSAGNWTAKPVPGASNLTSVSCTSANACTAVGGHGPTIARWNGSAWSSQAAASGSDASLVGVSCTDAHTCTAVGATGDGFPASAPPLGQQRQQRQRLPSAPAQRGELAPALVYQNAGGKAIAEGWNGSAWAAQAPQNRIGAETTDVNGVSCVAGTVACVAVGEYFDSASGQVLPVSEVEGSAGWKLIPVPVVSSPTSNLFGVSCVAQSTCVAVGDQRQGSGAVGLYGTWNGTSWTTGAVPAPAGGSELALNSVSCAATTACLAVGFDTVSGVQQAASATWNGTKWTPRTVPAPAGAERVVLTGVSCVGAKACRAVGSYFDPSTGDYELLAELWNGTAWTLGAAPGNPGSTVSVFYGVSCRTTSACTAVGNSFNASTGAGGALIDRWNGTQWTTQPAPAGFLNPYAVSCSTIAACMMVTSNAWSAWNATAWSATDPFIAQPGADAPLVHSVSCTASTSCVAAGTRVPLFGAATPLVEVYG